MFRTGYATTPAGYSEHRWKETWARFIAPLVLWICVSISLQYGYYGTFRMVLGPSSSRLVKASPIFVKKVEIVVDEAKKGALIYGFDQEPQLTLETNWTVSNYIIVGAYSRQGFSLWLNEGSRIRMRWEAHTSSIDHLQIVIIKGERNLETLAPYSSASSLKVSEDNLITGIETDYVIPENDKYYVSVVNTNPRSIITMMYANITTKMYDTRKASSVCSTAGGSCQLELHFPNTQFVVLTTPNNGDLGGWYIEISFVSRIVTYIAIIGSVVIIIFLILKYLGACTNINENDDGELIEAATATRSTTYERLTTVPDQQNETDPLVPAAKSTGFTYGTGGDDDLEIGSSASSESDELYDGKICVICYDEPRNCFFVPCGHCATCHDCALRIMEGENILCPICRRMIHKVRKLFTA